MTDSDHSTDPAEVDDIHNPEECTGWRGLDDDGRPIPCIDCRPWLRTTRRDWKRG
ncbi:hypothetical protein [Rhodococcus sp. HS-D2]|uniref:hypothetical protein n=1 Tax=Rhodococcus sp. HS-D2 TaxID=1384636 RepID=UPI000AB5BA7E|nr:hypothetical protein [Rhodococcus sp. HS-D2]